jgi:hypothetical protein
MLVGPRRSLASGQVIDGYVDIHPVWHVDPAHSGAGEYVRLMIAPQDCVD